MPRDPDSRRASAGRIVDQPDAISQPEESLLAQICGNQSDRLIFWLSPDGRLLYGNANISRMLGYSQRGFSALHIWDIIPRARENWPGRWVEVKKQLSRTLVVDLHTRNGAAVPSEFQVRYVTLGGKEYLLYRGRDLREDNSKNPTQLEETSASSSESAIDAIFVLAEEHVVDWNREAPAIFGHSRLLIRDQIKIELEAMLRESGEMRERMERVLQGETVMFNWHSAIPDGPPYNIECTLTRMEVEGHVLVIAVAVNVAAKRRSERTLAQLSGRLLQMQDEERRRVARELHDTTGQNLGALHIKLAMILSTTPYLDVHAREALEEAIALAETCIREIRTTSYLLHPPLLDELGLVSALRAYSEGYSERTSIRLELDLPASLERLPEAVEMALFRIVQEGLSNIHRHSGSRTAFLRLRPAKDSVELDLIDHGRGLPPGTLDWDVPSASRIGVGIAGMRERARQLGGRLTIASGENGTTLHVVLPATSAKV